MSITYLSGGLLGDFIHQLSVINENYIKTNKKGILYISNVGDTFRNGIEKTYNDLYEIVTSQEYIESFTIYNNEKYDVNLTEWRNDVWTTDNLSSSFKKNYNIEWGKHKWLNNIPKLNEWTDKIIINTVNYRFPPEEFFEPLKQIDLTNYVFISIYKEEYEFFTQKTNLNVEYYCPNSLLELSIILNSCQKVIGSLSAVLSIASGLHINCVYGVPGIPYFENIDLPFIKYRIT